MAARFFLPQRSSTIQAHSTCLVLLVLSLLAATPLHASFWDTDQRLSVTPAPSERPAVCTGMDGDVHAVWQEDHDGNTEINYAVFHGTGWSVPERLTAAPELSERPVVAMDADGHVWVFWHDNRTGNGTGIYYKKWDGLTWSHDLRLTSDGVDALNPSIVVDPIGNLHVVWEDSRHADMEIYYRRWNGFEWLLEERISDAGGISQAPCVSIDGKDQILVVWHDDRTGEYELYYRRWDGLQWSVTEILNEPAGDPRHPESTTDQDGDIHLVWYDYRDGDPAIYHKRWDGIVWSADERITTGPSWSVSPDIAADSHGSVHVAWYDDRDGNWEMYYKKWDGSSWATDERITESEAESRHPSIAATAEGTVHLVWQDRRDGNWEIYAKSRSEELPPGWWSPPERLTYDDGASMIPCIAADMLGNVHVAWMDDRTGSYDLFWKRHDGVNWTEDIQVTFSDDDSAWPKIASDPLGNVHMVWYDYRDGNPAIFHSFWNGIGWSDAARISEGYDWSVSPDVVADTEGQVHAVWYGNRDGNWELYYRRWDGIAWGPEDRLTHEEAESRYPRVDWRDGVLHLVWQERRYGHWDVYYKRLDGLSWSSDYRVTTDHRNSYRPTVAVGPSGFVHVAWYDDRDGREEIYEKSFNGYVWSVEERISSLDIYDSRDPSIVVDESGYVHVAWSEPYGEEDAAGIYYASWDGGGWSEPEKVSGESYDSSYPAMALGVAGQIELIWQDGRHGNYEIYRRTRTALEPPEGTPVLTGIVPPMAWNFGSHDLTLLGRDFSAPSSVRLMNQAGEVLNGDVLEVSPGAILARLDFTGVGIDEWAVIVRDAHGKADTLEHRFETRESPWSVEVNISDDPAGSSLCLNSSDALARDVSGALHAVWYDTRDGNLEIYWAMRQEGSWEAPARLTTDPSVSAYPACASSPLGPVAVVWQDGRDGNFEIYAKTYSDDVWSPDLRLTNNPLSSVYPSVACDGDGRFHLVWQDSRDGNWEIYYTWLQHGEWGEPIRVSENGHSSVYPSIACDQSGRVYAAWMDDRDGNWEIYAATLENAQWSAEIRITEDMATSSYPSLAARGSRVYLVWQDDRSGNEEIYLRRLDEMGSDERLTETSASSRTPTLSVAENGDLEVIWIDSRTGSDEVWYKKLDVEGGTWSLDHRVSDSTVEARFASVESGADGSLDIVWRDHREGNHEIFVRSRRELVPTDSGEPPAAGLQFSVRSVPNPFKDKATVLLNMPEEQEVRIEVFDVSGRRIRTLFKGLKSPGVHSIRWDGMDGEGRSTGPGIYFYRLDSHSGQRTGRMVRLQ